MAKTKKHHKRVAPKGSSLRIASVGLTSETQERRAGSQSKQVFREAIVIQSFNPYDSRFPGRRVVSRETLHLIKRLREAGYHIVVEPDDGTKLNYLTEKGIREFLSDPVWMFLLGIPVQVLLGLISNWIYDRLHRNPDDDEVSLVMEIDEDDRRVRYSHTGKPVSEERLREILAAMQEKSQRFASASIVTPPDATHTIPIHLEHTGKVVAWAASLETDELGLRLDGIKVTDDQTWERIRSGELTGLSIAGLVYSSTCGTCARDYTECNHIAGTEYDGVECSVQLTGIDLAEISIVTTPAASQALLHIVGH